VALLSREKEAAGPINFWLRNSPDPGKASVGGKSEQWNPVKAGKTIHLVIYNIIHYNLMTALQVGEFKN
jgi:hypothetical protein